MVCVQVGNGRGLRSSPHSSSRAGCRHGQTGSEKMWLTHISQNANPWGSEVSLITCINSRDILFNGRLDSLQRTSFSPLGTR